MTTRLPPSKALPTPRQGFEREGRSPFASDEERIARSTAWYEGDSQDSVDEALQSSGKIAPP
jgi:hypothetical protein